MPRRIVLILLAVIFSLNSSVTGSDLDFLFLDLRDAYCTDRCHVNSLSYKNDFEGEVFRHDTHSVTLDLRSASGGPKAENPVVEPSVIGLHCVDCHEDKEVNTEGHGRLIINKKDCLSCHHVDNRGMSCARCHKDIDVKPMEYKREPFVHGFSVDSDIDCRECHQPNARASMKEGVNCDKCHHARPHITCQGCHEESLKRAYYPRPAEINHLGWTTEFLHYQHPEVELSCQECHPPRKDRAKGVAEYQVNCSQCHHKEKADCHKCHQTVYEFFSGKLPLNGTTPIPDKMSRVLKCEDCHKTIEGGKGFSEVGEECARCHNKHYAELLVAQRGTILSCLDRLRKTLASPAQTYMWRDRGVNVNERTCEEETASSPGLLDYLEQYGLHNFSYARRILSLLEKDSKYVGEKNVHLEMGPP
ncbi:MAG TPA: cytochrome c3 family protein [Candidatus Hypogeohydataceae bacterium YC41]